MQKNSRSAERGCSSVLPPPNRRRMSTASNLALLPTGYAAQSRKARCKKQPERRALRPQARFGAQPLQAALGAEIGCSFALPAAEQAANGWSPQPCPTTSRLCRAIAQSAMHKQLSSPKRSPPPHTPLKHPAMYLLCIHIPQNSCTIFVILLCRGRLIAANSIYLINIVRLPHVGWAATKIPSRLQIKNKPNVK